MAIMLCLDRELAFEACVRLDSLKAAPFLGELMENARSSVPCSYTRFVAVASGR